MPLTSHLCRPAALRLGWLLLLLALAPAAPAQRFWLTTPAYPGGPKAGLLASGDSTLLTTVAAGLLHSTNRGRSWRLALRTRSAQQLFGTRAGLLLAGGRGQVFRSADGGLSWDSVALPTVHPVVAFTETGGGGLLAGTGEYVGPGQEVGDGVFFSADQGRTWTARSNGFGAGRFVNQLAADRHGRLYAAVASEDLGHQAGLYTSDDAGLSWQWKPMRINGRGQIYDDILTYEVSTLSLTPQDSLLCTVVGSSARQGVILRLTKHLRDVPDATRRWTVRKTTAGAIWWYGPITGPVHFARNGDWYSSRFGSPASGGTLLSRDQGSTWQLVRDGLGLSDQNLREFQHFAEFADGRVFMVQFMDERVYRTEASVVTAARTGRRPGDPVLQVYPNPATHMVQLLSLGGAAIRAVQVTDPRGRLVHASAPRGTPGEATTLSLAGAAAGVYLVHVTLADGSVLRQRLLKH
ncbi:hypothetical protein GCM10027048_01350 [Hymenobacter coalescens]